MSKNEDCSICCFAALAVAFAALAAIGLFWALVLGSVILGNDARFLMSYSSFWDKATDGWSYWYALTGAVLGAMIALGVERIQRRHEKKTAISSLVRCIEKNHNLLDDLLKYLSHPGGISRFGLDVAGMNLWLASSAAIIDQKVLEQIDAHRYELEHINTKLHTLYVSVAAMEFGETDDEKAEIRTQGVASLALVQHIIAEAAKGPLLAEILRKQL